jgi:hypothetical protein
MSQNWVNFFASFKIWDLTITQTKDDFLDLEARVDREEEYENEEDEDIGSVLSPLSILLSVSDKRL